jgi:DNA-binding response OmpR family regulator
MSRILVVEDSSELAEGIQYNLNLEGYEVRVAGTGPDAIDVVGDWNPDLVVLDLMLPGADGYQVLKAIRGRSTHLPVIILSARTEEQDKIRGFRLDADQYVTKPFSILELIERIAALLRRSGAGRQNSAHILEFGEVRVDLEAHSVERTGVPVTLTPKAFELLLALIRRQGKVVSRPELLRDVWGYGPFILTRTVDSHIAELRRKLDDPENPRHIVTVWKVGYRFIC